MATKNDLEVMRQLVLFPRLVEALAACTDFLHGQYLKDIQALLKEAKGNERGGSK